MKSRTSPERRVRLHGEGGGATGVTLSKPDPAKPDPKGGVFFSLATTSAGQTIETHDLPTHPSQAPHFWPQYPAHCCLS